MSSIIKYHMMAFVLGFFMDFLFGDPHWLPHPIRLIGNFIAKMEKMLRNLQQNEKQQYQKGLFMVVLILSITGSITAFLLIGAYLLNPCLGIAVETVMTYQLLAAKCLKVESMKVYEALKKEDLPGARKAVSMIVGRDTELLSKEGVAKAAIETVAENTSDGVIAPMLYTALLGPVLGFLYKAVNTMDSMVGYKNEQFLFFGRAAAKLDDVWNYLPARISAYLMIFACLFLGEKFDAKHGLFIFKRDRFNHASPNSAQTEAVCAGALSIQLAGNASYFGKVVTKPFIGDDNRPVEMEDIKRANQLLYVTAFTCEVVCLLFLGAVLLILPL